jgi:hypothetical protein
VEICPKRKSVINKVREKTRWNKYQDVPIRTQRRAKVLVSFEGFEAPPVTQIPNAKRLVVSGT